MLRLVLYKKLGSIKLFKKLNSFSVGNDTVWAISRNNELYFRENISKIFPEVTSWCLIDSYIKFVSVNQQNEVYFQKI